LKLYGSDLIRSHRIWLEMCRVRTPCRCSRVESQQRAMTNPSDALTVQGTPFSSNSASFGGFCAHSGTKKGGSGGYLQVRTCKSQTDSPLVHLSTKKIKREMDVVRAPIALNPTCLAPTPNLSNSITHLACDDLLGVTETGRNP
jgi:hypothetical protein